MNGRIVQPDTEFKLTELLNKRSELDLYPEFWVGIYDSAPGKGEWIWQDGSPVTYPRTEHEVPSQEQNCLRYDVDNLSDKNCNSTGYQIICEVNKGECNFGKLENKSVSNGFLPVITLSIALQKCLQICLWFVMNATECSGIVYHDVNQTCSLYATDIIPLATYINDVIIGNTNTTLYYKDCFSVEKIGVFIASHRNGHMADPQCRPQYDIGTITASTFTEWSSDMISVPACHSTITQTPSPSTETELLTVCPSSVLSLADITNSVMSSEEATVMPSLPCTTTTTETFCDSTMTVEVTDNCQPSSCYCEKKFASLGETLYPTGIQTTILETSVVGDNMVSASNKAQILQMSETYKNIKDRSRENILDIHNLSSYKRRFISVPDQRPSAITIGVCGSICIVVFFLSIIICDLRCKNVTKSSEIE